MDTETAIANLVPGKEVSYLARCIDTLLKIDYNEPAIFDKLLPFLGHDLFEQSVIEYSADPGVDINDDYFVLWEPFIRAKAALLIGTVAEKATKTFDGSTLVAPLIAMLNGEEDIEQAFSLFALTEIGLKRPQIIAAQFTSIVKSLTGLVKKAANPSRAFSLFHSKPFQNQVYESFLDFCYISGILDNPDYVQRFIASGFPLAILQIAVSAPNYVEKKPEMQWKLLWAFLRFVTEHPTGTTFFDIDVIPKSGIDVCTLMRIAIKDKNRAVEMRNAMDKIPVPERTTAKFQEYSKAMQSK